MGEKCLVFLASEGFGEAPYKTNLILATSVPADVKRALSDYNCLILQELWILKGPRLVENIVPSAMVAEKYS
jgi:hypothetical protein